MKSFIPLSYFFLIVCDLYTGRNGLLCNAFSSTSRINPRTMPGRTRISSFLNAETKDEITEGKDKSTDSEPITLYELAEMEARASKRVNDRLLLPYRLGRAIYYGTLFFLFSCYVLNAFGYGYIRGEYGFLTIGTLEERNFQQEMTKGTRKAMENSVDAVTKSQIEVDAAMMKQ